MKLVKKYVGKVKRKMKSKIGQTIVGINTLIVGFLISSQPIYGANGTEKVAGFITFICDWLLIIGGVVALIGAVMFALGFQREDAEGKTRGLLTMMAGFMVIGISQSPSLFGI